jgi:hypothetical protein
MAVYLLVLILDKHRRKGHCWTTRLCPTDPLRILKFFGHLLKHGVLRIQQLSVYTISYLLSSSSNTCSTSFVFSAKRRWLTNSYKSLLSAINIFNKYALK